MKWNEYSVGQLSLLVSDILGKQQVKNKASKIKHQEREMGIPCAGRSKSDISEMFAMAEKPVTV